MATAVDRNAVSDGRSFVRGAFVGFKVMSLCVGRTVAGGRDMYIYESGEEDIETKMERRSESNPLMMNYRIIAVVVPNCMLIEQEGYRGISKQIPNRHTSMEICEYKYRT